MRIALKFMEDKIIHDNQLWGQHVFFRSKNIMTLECQKLGSKSGRKLVKWCLSASRKTWKGTGCWIRYTFGLIRQDPSYIDTAQSIYTTSWTYPVATCSWNGQWGKLNRVQLHTTCQLGPIPKIVLHLGGILKGFKWFQGCHPIFNSSKIRNWTEKGLVTSLLMCYQSIARWPSSSFHKVWKPSDNSQSFKCCLPQPDLKRVSLWADNCGAGLHTWFRSPSTKFRGLAV